MTIQQQGDFCFDYSRADDGAVLFTCSQDSSKWPWLKLHPAHNIAVQATNYFSLTGVSLFTGQMDGEKWTALTQFKWHVFNIGEGAAHPVRGRAVQEEDGIGYTCRFFDGDDQPIYDVSGAGVVFRNRDFKGWRAKNRAQIMALPEARDFTFAAPADVGVATSREVFVSPLQQDGDGDFVDALVTLQSGFAPAHPYHGGSGDHVNSSHLCDVAQQAARLIRNSGAQGGFPSSGSVAFHRYVELDRPFRLRVTHQNEPPDRLGFAIQQGDFHCADLRFEFEQ